MVKVTIEIPEALADMLKAANFSPERFVTMATKSYTLQTLEAATKGLFPVTIYVPRDAAEVVENDPEGEKLQAMCQQVFDYGVMVAGESVMRQMKKEGKVGTC